MKILTLSLAKREAHALRRLEHEVYVHRVERKLDSPVGIPSQDAGRKQSVHIAMNRLYVTVHAARRLAQRHRTAAGRGFWQPPALGGQDFPERNEPMT